MQPRVPRIPSFCNDEIACAAGSCRKAALAGGGTPDAFGGGMKDLVFIAATFAFFAVAWFYAKSFDHL